MLAEREKADMEEEIQKHLRCLRGTRVLCRCTPENTVQMVMKRVCIELRTISEDDRKTFVTR